MRIPALLASISLCVALSFSITPSLAAEAAPGDAKVKVKVSMVDPAKFSEIRQNRRRGDLRDGLWLDRLQQHIIGSATKRLAPGEALEVRVIDIKRAGDFEPWHGPQFDDVRIVKDIYPPRIALSYTLTSADGAVISQGDEVLRDAAFLSRALRGRDDPLRYEKRLLDDWLAKLLPSKHT